ncbi:hypothetical protein ASC97_04320 [Rhizobium sp. Root1203]|uniref:DUF2313 domain-containing protein n=1 Tax=Rhizobium sp. Root1203 TaxID=1736427 RepID=UPI00070A02B3|nr:DUF2313 domain-containing protein [Rhizobium sp. Root1203]KQV27608.1 hypothetical protein ASC97_04320 [Rhizobium sp. Root1203]
MSKSPWKHTLTNSFTPRTQMALTVPGDALSQPTNDDLISAGLSFWPPGAAWGSPDGEAVSLDGWIGRFTRVLLAPFEFLYARAWQLVGESSAQTANETLDEWEADHGLPERCFTGEQSTAQRLAALRRKVAAEPLNHPEDFVRVAADFGFAIEIEEPCLFECGFSESGSYHEAGAAAEEAYIVVRVRDASISYFEAGASELGFDPLFSLGGSEQILCFIRQELPGWVLAIPEAWIAIAELVTENGAVIVDEYGNSICVTL